MNWHFWTSPMFTSAIPSVESEIVRQSQDCGQDNFFCDTCRNYKGGLKCEQGIFIAFTGANMALCRFYKKGKKCPHCGRII